MKAALLVLLLPFAMAGEADAQQDGVREQVPSQVPSAIASWLGREVPPYPDGLEKAEGTCIPGDAGIEHICDYGIAVWRDPQGIYRHLVAGQLLGHDPAGRARWRLLDVLPYPVLPEGYGLTIGLCEIDGRVAPNVAATVDMSRDTEWFAAIDKAWRLDFGRKRLVETRPDGIRCRNEGFGYDG